MKLFSRLAAIRAARQVDLIQPLEGRRLLSVSLPSQASDSAMAPVRVDWAAEATVRKPEIIGRDTNGSPTAGFSGYVSTLPLDVPLSEVPPEYHVLPLPEDRHGSNSLSSPAPTAAPAASVAGDVFALNSLPGANHVIYLDFDGHTTSGTHWNGGFNDGLDITTPAFDIDDSPSTFSTTEQVRIEEVWLRVAEDFAPFNVNVTTQDPGLDYLSRSGSGDARWGVRVVIGGSSSDWFGSGGGVAYVGSFTWSNDTPVFVFSESLWNNAKSMAEAASHEAGHALGLLHDGRDGSDYYGGHNNGNFQTSWGPIMGASYSRNVTQWSTGQYNGATNTENDLVKIASTNNGFGYKTDDHPDSLSTINDGTPLELDTGGTFFAGGLISDTKDEDNFTFEHDGGQITLAADPVAVGPNLDISLQLYRWNGSAWSLVASDNNSSRLDADIVSNFGAGTYLARVNGVGWGDPYASSPSGYTEYGSLGQYTLTGSFTKISDTIAPQVTGVWFGSTAWSSAFNNEIDSDEGLGMAVGTGSGAAQLAPLPFNNVDVVRVRFSEEVVVNANALTAATSAGQPLATSGFAYDASTFTATWTLGTPFARGTYNISVDDAAVADLAGNALDGEWDNPTGPSDASSDTFPSGNAVAGGDFVLTTRVLPGDSNRDGSVSLADFLALRGAFGGSVGSSTYSLFADYDGNGNVSLADFLILRSNFGQTV